MKLVNDTLAVPVELITPTDHGFVMLAAEFGRWVGPFAAPSRTGAAPWTARSS